MIVLSGRNVNSLFPQGLKLLRDEGILESTRAGKALVLPVPVCSIYERPQERVLFHPSRDANPFFHLFEALWMLAGRRDATWLDQFVGDFSQRFAEDDGNQHGAYGFRWRRHFDMEGGGEVPFSTGWTPDQLEGIVSLLRSDPSTRRAVLTMWDPVADLGADKRDLPCNTHCYFRVRQPPTVEAVHRRTPSPALLDLTICCRSNDAIWGAYGANAVHFSILQEYVAQRCGLGIGHMYQISNNFHAYTEVLDKIDLTPVPDPYLAPDSEGATWIVDPKSIEDDLQALFEGTPLQSWFFCRVARPLLSAHRFWKSKSRSAAIHCINQAEPCDWTLAARQWLDRRIRAKELSHAS